MGNLMMGDRLRASFVLLQLNFLSTHCFIFNKSPPSENLNSVDNATSMILDNILPTAETMEQKTENEYNKMETVKKETSFPYYVVLSQTGNKEKDDQVASSNTLIKRQGGLMQDLSAAVANTRFITSPSSMASFLGMGILQFLGMQAIWLLLMTLSSVVKRRKRSYNVLDLDSIDSINSLTSY